MYVNNIKLSDNDMIYFLLLYRSHSPSPFSLQLESVLSNSYCMSTTVNNQCPHKMLPEAIVDILPTIIVGSVIVFIIYRLSTRQSRKLEKTFPNIDGPKPWPLIGDLPSVIQAKGQIHLLFDGYYRQYGRLFKADFFGQTGLVISEPGMLREILVKRFDCFYNRPVSISIQIYY